MTMNGNIKFFINLGIETSVVDQINKLSIFIIWLELGLLRSDLGRVVEEVSRWLMD